MIVGVPREIKPGDRRVALTPARARAVPLETCLGKGEN